MIYSGYSTNTAWGGGLKILYHHHTALGKGRLVLPHALFLLILYPNVAKELS